MRKSLLALAIFGAFAGAASAQSSVTVYGVVDLGVLSDDDGTARKTGLESGLNAASRVGFRGVEDLGGGLKATFLLESGFRADTGALSTASSLFNRLSYVGLEGNFGALRLGRQNSPMKTAMDVADPFKNAGNLGMVDAFGFYPGDGNVYSERVSNLITYTTPNFSGFSGSLGYQFGEVAGDNSANRSISGQLGYANGPLSLAFGYEQINGPAGLDEKQKNMFFGGNYDFGAFRLHAAVGDAKFEDPTDNAKVRNYMVGVTVPFGANAIRATYIRNDVKFAPDANSTQLGISYTYALSKRTTLYAAYAHVSNDSGADLTVATPGQSGNRIMTGIQHNF